MISFVRRKKIISQALTLFFLLLLDISGNVIGEFFQLKPLVKSSQVLDNKQCIRQNLILDFKAKLEF